MHKLSRKQRIADLLDGHERAHGPSTLELGAGPTKAARITFQKTTQSAASASPYSFPGHIMSTGPYLCVGLTGGSPTLSHFPIDGSTLADNTTPVRQLGGTRFALTRA